MKIKRNKKSYKWFLCGLILVVVLTITYKVSKANYRISNSIELTTGKVISSPYDFNIVSIYIDGVEQSKDTIIPDDSYVIDETNSYCYKESKSNRDNNVTLKTIDGTHSFNGISKSSKCILYFQKDTTVRTMSELLENYYTNKKVRAEGTFNQQIVDITKKVVYSAEDDNGTSYYFAGNPLDNWVEFGGYYWRIIRVNGDGSIRMIYQGRTKDENGKRLEAQATGVETVISRSKFNDLADNNRYTGYWYGEDGDLRGLKYPSTIYTILNNWFKKSGLIEEINFSKIDINAGFCGDRTPSSSRKVIDNIGGTGTKNTYYAAFVRLRFDNDVNSEFIAPTFKCANSNDLYTYNNANKGNKVLENPVGLITADEGSYAGLRAEVSNNNENYLCNNSKYYWTMTPAVYFNITNLSAAFNFYIRSNCALGGTGSASGWVTSPSYEVRPVINLRSDVTFTGTGTKSNPYKVI